MFFQPEDVIEWLKERNDWEESADFTQKWHIIGSHQGRSRVVLVMKGPHATGGRQSGLISVANMDKDGIHEQYTYVTDGGDPPFLELEGVVDTDRDGLADVILINGGYFDMAALLILANNKWQRQDAEGPIPC